MTKAAADAVSLKSAAYWFVELQEQHVSLQTRQQFEEWLQQPQHRAAWDKVLQMHQTFEQFQQHQQQNPDIEKLLQQPAMSRRTALKCLAVFGTSFFTYMAARTPWSKSQWYALAADHAAAVGQSQTVRLTDQLQVWLNTNSAIDSTVSATQTLVNLLQGEMFVHLQGSSMQADLLLTSKVAQQQIMIASSGCQLNLYNYGDGCTVSLYQGDAVVTVAQQPLSLTAGQQINLKSSGDIDYKPVTSLPDWREGKLVANAMTLSQFCAELNRYRRGIISVNTDAESLLIDGVFPAFAPDTALDMLVNTLPVKINHFGPWWVQVSLA
ncbi:FecR family protein [Rheinheimera gaetbuli]